VVREFVDWVMRQVEETAARLAGKGRPPGDAHYVLAARIVVGPQFQSVLRPVRERASATACPNN
jgi:hypothetical protein